MKSVLIYSSPKGKCQKVAEKVGKQLDMPVYNVRNLTETIEADFFVLVGGGPYSGDRDGALEGFIKKQKEHFTKTVAIVTLDSNFFREGDNIYKVRVSQKLLHTVLKEKKVDILGEHICLTRLFCFYPTHPNKRDIYKTTKWLTDIMRLAQKAV